MKEIKAFIHTHRIADVLQAIKEAKTHGSRFCNLAVFPIKTLLRDPDLDEAHYSMDLAETVVNEVKIEILCPDEAVTGLVALIKGTAYAGGHEAGWIVVTGTLIAEPIGDGNECI